MHSRKRKACKQNSDLFLGAAFHRKEGRKKERKKRHWKIAAFPERAPLSLSLHFSFLPSVLLQKGTRALRLHFWRRMQSDSICGPSLSYKNGTSSSARPIFHSPSLTSFSGHGALYSDLSRVSSFGQVFFGSRSEDSEGRTSRVSRHGILLLRRRRRRSRFFPSPSFLPS